MKERSAWDNEIFSLGVETHLEGVAYMLRILAHEYGDLAYSQTAHAAKN